MMALAKISAFVGLIGLAISLSACQQDVSSEVGITGHLNDRLRYVPLTVQPQWEGAVLAGTRDAAAKNLEYPKTANVSSVPTFDAYYDKVDDMTRLTAFGYAQSTGDYGQVSRQVYYVVWEKPDHAKGDGPWELYAVEVVDQPTD